MTLKTKIIIFVVYSTVLIAGGYYLAPEKIKTEIKTVEVEKKVEDTKTKTNNHKETTVTEVTHPDGTKETTTKTVEDNKAVTDTKDQTDIAIQTDQTKEVTKSSKHLNISALGGVNVLGGITATSAIPTYGAHVSTNLLGPITVGVWGLSNGLLGASLGIQF